MFDINNINRMLKIFYGISIELENIVSVEWRLNLNSDFIENDFYLCISFNKDIKQIDITIRIKNNEIKEFYFIDTNKLRLINIFKINEAVIQNNENILSYIEKCPNLLIYNINNAKFLYRFDSINLKNEHTDLYFYSKDKTNHSMLFDIKYYNDNFCYEMHRYDSNSLKLNQLNIFHNHEKSETTNKYLFPVLNKYKPWRVFYYFNLDNLINPHSIVFDGRYSMTATKELFENYFGNINLPNLYIPN